MHVDASLGCCTHEQLESEAIEKLAQLLKPVIVQADEFVCRHGEPCKGIFFVVSGLWPPRCSLCRRPLTGKAVTSCVLARALARA